jgi:hypothetical protein
MLLYLMHLSHEPNLELNVPPPNCCASFVTAVRTQVSHALAISLIEWDSGRFLRARENAACTEFEMALGFFLQIFHVKPMVW